jgi:SAM-dependent methyltransferase
MVPDGSIDVVVSNCVLNLVSESDRQRLFDELFRVLKPRGRAVISDIVASREVPRRLKEDPKLWSGCISGAFVEKDFLAAFAAAGFDPVRVVQRQAAPWAVVEEIEFRSVTVRADKPVVGESGRSAELAIVSAACCGNE